MIMCIGCIGWCMQASSPTMSTPARLDHEHAMVHLGLTPDIENGLATGSTNPVNLKAPVVGSTRSTKDWTPGSSRLSVQEPCNRGRQKQALLALHTADSAVWSGPHSAQIALGSTSCQEFQDESRAFPWTFWL